MYPTIGTYDVTGGMPMYQPAQQSSAYSQHPPHIAAANGPASQPLASPGAAASPSSFPTLRVHIAEPYRTAPPVRAALSALPPTKPANPLSLDYERKVLDDIAAAAAAASAQEDSRPDPYSVLLKRYTDKGYTREEAAMGLAMVGEDTDDADKVVECCEQYRNLRSMEFKADLVVGALVLSKGDTNKACDLCLSANMDS